MKQTILSITTFLFLFIGMAPYSATATGIPPQAEALFGKTVTLRAGTPILLELGQRLPSDQMTVGRTIEFRVRTDVRIDGRVAIRTGALAMGRIKRMQESTYNDPASLTIEVTSVQAVDGQQIPLNGAEQTLRGQRTGEGLAAAPGAQIVARAMNDIEVEVK